MADEKKSGPNKEELEELEGEIEHARRDGDEAIRGSFYEGDTPMYLNPDSGDEEPPEDYGEGTDSESDAPKG